MCSQEKKDDRVYNASSSNNSSNRYSAKTCIYCGEKLKMRAAFYCGDCDEDPVKIDKEEIDRLLNPRRDEHGIH